MKISRLFFKEQDNLSVFFISLWYSFNTYTLIYLHGNAFSLTLLICYALAPLAFYFYHKSIFGVQEKIDRLKVVLLFFFMSFAVYLHAAFLLCIAIYTFLFTYFEKVAVSKVIKNIFLLIIMSLPTLGILFLIPYDMFFSSTATINTTGGETFGNLQGGLLYPLLMWFSWGIYTFWEPRNIFTFTDYFRTLPSLIAPFIIYALLLPGILAKKKKPLFFLFLFLFLLFLFLIKGPQAPFGDIYVWIVQHIPGFRVFRSPDNKFGFILIFLLCLLLLYVSSSYKRKVFISLVSLVILIQGYLIFNGVAIRGENTVTSSDRIVKVPQEYYHVATYFNENASPYGYIMPIPSAEFGHYRLEPHKRHIGQDILPKLTNLPFLYITADSGIASNTYEKLSTILKEKDIKKLSVFPIKYFLLRNDSYIETKDEKELKKRIAETFKEKYQNKYFVVFENEHFTPLIQARKSTFIMESPIRYKISLKNIKEEQTIIFNQSYNPNWVLYPAKSDELKLLFTPELFTSTHDVANGYANSWHVSAESVKASLDKKDYTINADGSVDLDLILYFKTQVYFYLGIMVTSIYLIIISLYLLWHDIVRKRIHL
ncbi:MAG: hypothetical protein AAB553_00325 [Patescibacteria group bacterium]